MWPQPEFSDCVSQKVKGQRLAPELALIARKCQPSRAGLILGGG